MVSNKKFFKFSKEQEEQISLDLKDYLEEEQDIKITFLQSKLLFDYISSYLGNKYYNKGIEDAIAFMNEKVDDLFVLMRKD